MTSAAAASPQATAGPKAAATAAMAIGGDWEGSYTCGSAATGLDLTIQSSVVTGTWKSSYLGCTQGPTGLTLIVKPAGQTGNQFAAKFEFHAAE